MTVHGADWFIPEQAQYYTKWNNRYMRLFVPIYIRKAANVISVSQETSDNYNRVLNVPSDKIKTIYFAPARHFLRIKDPVVLQKIRSRYNLPEKFILTLTKQLGGGRKNLGQILKAYACYHEQVKDPHKLVIGGKDCHKYREEYGIPDDGFGRDILFPGWIEQADMPAVYSLADLYLYPSNLEAFPIPLTEAMACGTPILTSNVNGLKEIAGDAAILVDPTDPEAIANALARILMDPELRTTLSLKGLDRSTIFTWDTCSLKTLALFENAVLG
jgi:glycosyltransferase involved in cell wall biosynthesis